MKKIILTTASVLAISLGGYAVADNLISEGNSQTEKVASIVKSEKTTKVMNSHGKTDDFENIEELENSTPIIVRGVKTQVLNTDFDTSKVTGEIVSGYTESEFKILEVIKNEENNEKIKVDSNISVGEMAFENEGTIYTINGYQEMKDDKEYLLYLVEQDGLFAPRGVVFGKIPLDSQELEIYTTDSSEDVEDAEEATEIQETFEPLFDEVREKYAQ